MRLKVRFFFLLSFSLLAFGGASLAAYTPDTATTEQLTSLKTTLANVSAEDLWKYYKQLSQLKTAVRGHDDRLDYLLSNLSDFSYSQFSSQKSLSKQLAKPYKQEFITDYQDKLLLDSEVPTNCLGWYNLLDNLSYANNFPTALTIAVWHRETTCGYILPKNGDGPFQIVSKDYGSWEITEAIFAQTVQDFLDFAHHKIQRYNNANQKNGLAITLSYTGASFTDLIRFSALYNWLSGSTVYGEVTPMAPRYFREGYENDVWTWNAVKDGILSMYLKVLKWEGTH